MKEVIPTFLDFEKSILKANLKEGKWLIWPLLRTAVFEELINDVNKKKGLSGNTKRSKFSLNKIFFKTPLFFKEIASLLNYFKRADILVINNESKVFKIDGKRTNKLISIIEEALGSELKVVIFNTQITDIQAPNIPIVRISLLLSSLTRIIYFFRRSKSLKKSIEFIADKALGYYGVNLDHKFLKLHSFFRQIALATIIKIYIKMRKPRLLIFSDHGSMNAVNKVAEDMKVETIDYQHAISTSFHIVYSHGESLSNEYVQYLSKYFFAWGEYSISRLKDRYKCMIVGNAQFERSKKKYQNVKKERSILIVSDDQLTRKYLEETAVFLSEMLPDYQINYKLRPEEYFSWKSHYLSNNQEIKNLKFIDNDFEDLYSYITKSEFVIGTSSSVLIEAAPFSKVFILERGWSYVMQDYISDGILKSSDSKEGIFRLISDQHVNEKINEEKLFFPYSVNLFKTKVMDLLEINKNC